MNEKQTKAINSVGSLLNRYGMGVVVHLVMLALMLLLPGPVKYDVVRVLALPLLLIYPITSVLLSQIVFRQQAHRRAQVDLRISEEKFRSYIENAPDVILVTDEQGNCLEANRAAALISGYDPETLLTMNLRDIVADDLAYARLSEMVRQGSEGTMRLDMPITHKNGTKRWVSIDVIQLSNNRFLSFASDITERKAAADELLHISCHDYLTGLINRRCFENELVKLDTPDALPLSIIIGDINGLKLINDTFGRIEGDNMIAQTAQILQNCLNGTGIIARTSGDEFSILLPRTDRETAYARLNTIKSTIQAFNETVQNEAFQINVSLGFETRDSVETDFLTVIKSAEDYMHQRKLLEGRSSHSAIISSIQATLMEKSHETKDHADRLVELSRTIGIELNLSQKEMDNLELLSMLHDLGKVGVPDHILNKPGRLTDDEWVVMKKHPEIGYRIATASPELSPIADYILSHHERWDGTGYPQKLAGRAIPLLARILAVADAFDAMTEDRPYRKAMSRDDAVIEIQNHSGTQFDPELVDIFLRCL